MMNSDLDISENGYACLKCGHGSMHKEYIQDTFEYGSGKEQVNLKVWVPLDVCDNCHARFNTEEADRTRHDEICRHLQLLTPGEVLRIRVSQQMSQAKFAELTGIGVASLSRWESGQLLQSKSHDNLLRLSEAKFNIDFLQRRARSEIGSIAEMEHAQNKIQPKVLTGQKLNSAKAASSMFGLRQAG
jgi:putative zinc finger/helix-turn-helix YgiT family protein